MTKVFVTRPAMTIVFVLFFVVLGIRAYFDLNTEEFPDIDFPIVSVKTVYAGASPEEIETQIVKRIEEVVSEISQIEKIRAEIYENMALTLIEFDLGADVNVKSIEVKDKVESIINDLPPAADRPEVAKFDPLVQPIVELTLSSDRHDARELFEYADKSLKDRLSILEGVANVDVYGGKKRQINVLLDPLLMKRHYLSIDEVLSAIRARNVSVPGGSYDKLRDRISVRTYGEFAAVEDLADLEIVTRDNTRVRLSQIASVQDYYREVESHARHNGEEVVGLSVMRLADGNAVRIADSLNRRLLGITDSLPEGMRLKSVYQAAERIVESRNNTVVNILIGIGLTVLILLLFIGKFRVTLVAAVVIPTSIVSALFPMSLSGFTINFATLLAIATALGTLIANSLVVIEAVEQHIRKGVPPEQAAVDGTREVAVAVFAAAGTNLCVFAPMAFMGGIIGQFMFHFGMTIIYVTVFSLLASFTLTPMMCARLLKPNGGAQNHNVRPIARSMAFMVSVSDRSVGWMLREYRYVFDWTFRRPRWVAVMALIALVSAAYPIGYLGSEFVSPHDQGEMLITVEMPPGTNLTYTAAVTEQVEALLLSVPEVVDVVSNAGGTSPDKASLKVKLVHRSQRRRSDSDIINALIPDVAKIPDAQIGISREVMSGGVESDLDINIFGDRLDDIVAGSEAFKSIMLESGFFRSVSSSYRGRKDEVRFVPRQDDLIRYNLRAADVGATVRAMINGDDLNVFKEGGEEYKINVELSKDFKTSQEEIGRLDILSDRGFAKLSSLGSLDRVSVLPSLSRRDKRTVIQIRSYLQKSSAGEVRDFLDEKFAAVQLPEGVGYQYVGNAEYQDESAREISRAFVLAVILTYMLLAGLMNSFVRPFVIMTSVATSFVGVFYFLFFMEHSINIGAMMAMVMVVGLVVNNAILIIDASLKRRSEHHSLADAIWAGSKARFRTILMTSLAIVMGALPQVFDAMGAKAAIGGVVVGGMLGSIVFTLLLIPITFFHTEKARQR